MTIHSYINSYDTSFSTYLYLSSVFNNDIMCIYGIFNKIDNSCIYIGSTTCLQNRIPWHHEEYQLFPERKLYRHVRTSGGWNTFYFKILEQLSDITNIYLREKLYINILAPSANSISPPNKIILSS